MDLGRDASRAIAAMGYPQVWADRTIGYTEPDGVAMVVKGRQNWGLGCIVCPALDDVLGWLEDESKHPGWAYRWHRYSTPGGGQWFAQCYAFGCQWSSPDLPSPDKLLIEISKHHREQHAELGLVGL